MSATLADPFADFPDDDPFAAFPDAGPGAPPPIADGSAEFPMPQRFQRRPQEPKPPAAPVEGTFFDRARKAMAHDPEATSVLPLAGNIQEGTLRPAVPNALRALGRGVVDLLEGPTTGTVTPEGTAALWAAGPLAGFRSVVPKGAPPPPPPAAPGSRFDIPLQLGPSGGPTLALPAPAGPRPTPTPTAPAAAPVAPSAVGVPPSVPPPVPRTWRQVVKEDGVVPMEARRRVRAEIDAWNAYYNQRQPSAPPGPSPGPVVEAPPSPAAPAAPAPGTAPAAAGRAAAPAGGVAVAERLTVPELPPAPPKPPEPMPIARIQREQGVSAPEATRIYDQMVQAFEDWHQAFMPGIPFAYLPPGEPDRDAGVKRAEIEAALAPAPSPIGETGGPVSFADELPAPDDGYTMVQSGEALRSNTGRALSPVPRIDATTNRKTGASLQRLDAWLHAEAVADAEASGNDWFITLLRGMDPKRLSPADRDSLNMMLFGDERGPRAKHRAGSADDITPPPMPAGSRSILRPLTPAPQPPPADATPPQMPVAEDYAPPARAGETYAGRRLRMGVAELDDIGAPDERYRELLSTGGAGAGQAPIRGDTWREKALRFADAADQQGEREGPTVADLASLPMPRTPLDEPGAATQRFQAARTAPGTRRRPARAQQPQDIAQAAAQAMDPTEGQAAAGNFAKGHVSIGGLPITIENPAGSTRSGTAPDGTKWTAQLAADYGYVKRSTGADGDQVDVFLGPDAHQATQHPVWVIDQKHTDGSGGFDEHKAMLGFPSEAAARMAYLGSFSDDKGTDRIGAVTQLSWPQFKRWVRSGETNKPLKMKERKLRVAKPKARKPAKTLLEFLAAQGGIKPHGDLKAMEAHKKFMFGFGSLVRKAGMPLDRARELAEEAGFLRGGSMISDLLAAIDEELNRGRAQTSSHTAGDDYLEERARVADVEGERVQSARDAVEATLREMGITEMLPAEVDAAVLMVRQGADAEDAVVAVLERSMYAAAEDAAASAPAGSEWEDIPFDGAPPNEDADRLGGAGAEPSGASDQATGAVGQPADEPAAAGERGGQGRDVAGAQGRAQPAAGAGPGQHRGEGGQDAGVDAPAEWSVPPLKPGQDPRSRTGTLRIGDYSFVVRQRLNGGDLSLDIDRGKSVWASAGSREDLVDVVRATIAEGNAEWARATPPQTETVDTLDGKREQSLIPGVAPVTDREKLQVKADAPKRGGDAPPGGIFGPVGQTDLVDHTRSTLYGSVAAPNVEALTEAFRKRIAERGDFPSDQQAMKFAGQLLGSPILPGSRAARIVRDALEAAHRYRSPEMLAADEAHQAAFAEHEAARVEHMAGRMSDQAYLAVRGRLEAAKKAYDEAEKPRTQRAKTPGAGDTSDQMPSAAAIEAVAKAVEAITGGQGKVAFVPGGITMAGTTVNGLALGPLILTALAPNVAWTLHHESIHVLRNLGVIRPAEWKVLRAAAEREGWLAEFDILQRYAHLAAEDQSEEAVAEKFGQWSSGEQPAPKGMVGRAWNRVRGFIDRTGNLLRGRGFQTADDVFERIRSGEVGKRAPGSATKQRGPQTVQEALQRLSLFGQFDGPSDGALASLLREARFSLPPRAQANLPFTPPASFASPPETRLDSVLYQLQDKHVDTKRVIEAIKDAGRTIADFQDPYLAEELYHGRTAKQTADFLNDELRPLLQDAVRRGVSLADLERFLWARHAEERNIQIAKINPAMPDGGSGMDTADARAALAAYTPAEIANLDALARQVDAIAAGTRRLLVSYGLESQDTVNKWASVYRRYVPLNREDMEGIEGGQGTGAGFSIRGPASRRAMGSERAVVNIIANLAAQRERTIVRGEKNIVANALVELVRANPNEDFWKLNRPTLKKVIDSSTGLVTTIVDPNYKGKDNVIVARSPGRGPAAGSIVEQTVTFNERDPRAMRMARSLKNLDLDDLGHVLGPISRATRFIAAINTQYNPVFGVTNLVRDVQEGMLNLSTTPIAGRQAEVAAYVPSALAGIYNDLRAIRRGMHASSPWSQLFEEFEVTGGKTGFRAFWGGSDERAKAIEAEIKQVTEGKAKRFGRAVFGWLSDYNEAIENSVRLSAYRVALDAGMSKERAASLAKNLTVNFNRKGAMTTQLSALYAFFNAATQGTTRFLQTLAGPTGKKIVGGALIVGAMQAAALEGAGFSKADIPEFVREKNIIIPIGGKRYLTIPMPLGFSILPNVGRIATEIAIDGGKDAGKKLAGLIGATFNAANPLGGTGMSMQTIAPTLADPFAALAENRDWTGRSIAREDISSLDPSPGYQRAKEGANPFSTWVAKRLNELTGGTDFQPGGFSPTPDQIDYLVGQFTGGIGRETVKAIQTVNALRTGDPIPTNRIPLVGRFYGNAEGAAAVRTTYYENVKALNGHEREIKGRVKAGQPVQQYIARHPEAALFQAANRETAAIAKMQKARREMTAANYPKERIKALDDQITARMKAFNEIVKRAEKR